MPRAAQARSARGAGATTTRAFLFSDLRGYTDYVERKGDAAAARLLKDYRTLVRREVARHAGAEVKTEGDSFYVVFESVGAALDCAVAIQRRAAARNEKDAGAPIQVGMGLHAGETVAFDQQFVGSAVNVASRLAGQAGSGEIVVSDTLRGLVRTSTPYALRDRGALDLKGVGEAVRAWTVVWRESADEARPDMAVPLLATVPTIAAPAPGQIVCPVVVGRADERRRAYELLEASAKGRGQTLVVGGEAGVGKSAFVRDLIGSATERGYRLLYGATLEADSGLPYAPFIAAVRSGFRGLERDRLGRVLSQAAPDLAELFPELGRASRGLEHQDVDQRRIDLAFHGLFATFARETPVLLVIEDLHWSDEASHALLTYLARELRDARVLLLATYRSDEMHRRHPLLRVLAALDRERLASQIALKRLSPDDVRELIRATFAATDPDITVSDAFRDAIYTRSEGNPFFTEELLKSLVESGGIYFDAKTGWERKPIEELQIPGSIREAVRERVERLSPEARDTLAVAAVIGLQFGFETLRTARSLDEASLEKHLREFIEQQLVVELGAEDRYAFRHALTKEVVYDDLLVRERKRLHRSVADALAADARTEPAVVAYHLLAAGETQRAVPLLLAAGDRAHRAGAPREAVAHYGRAIEIGVADDALAAVIERQAEAYLTFDAPLSIKAAEEALALYRTRGDRRGESRVQRLAGRAHFYASRPVEAERLTQDAIDVLGGDESVELARALAQQAGLFMARTALAESLPLADRAIALGERLGDQWTLAHALITKGSSVRGPEAGRLLRQGLDIARRGEVVEAATRGYNNLAIHLIREASPLAERRAVIEEGLAYARAHGIEAAALSYLLAQRLVAEIGTGDWDDALVTAAEMSELSLVARWSVVERAYITTWREGPDAALPIFEELRARDLPDGSSRITFTAEMAAAYARARRPSEAREELRRLADLISAHPRGPVDHDTPRSGLGGVSLWAVLTTALLLDAPEWIDEAEAEVRPSTRLGKPARALVAAARAVLAGDMAACVRALEAASGIHGPMGFDPYDHTFAIVCLLSARDRGTAIGPEWRPLASRIRSFGEREHARARWWLEVLEGAGL